MAAGIFETVTAGAAERNLEKKHLVMSPKGSRFE